MYREVSAKDKPAEPPLGKAGGNGVGIPGGDGLGLHCRGGDLAELRAG